MPDVLGMTALEIRHPVLLVVLMKTDDSSWHSTLIGRHCNAAPPTILSVMITSVE